MENVAGNAETVLGKRSNFSTKLFRFVFENALCTEVEDVFFVKDTEGFYLFVVAMERNDLVNCVTIKIRSDALCLSRGEF